MNPCRMFSYVQVFRYEEKELNSCIYCRIIYKLYDTQFYIVYILYTV